MWFMLLKFQSSFYRLALRKNEVVILVGFPHPEVGITNKTKFLLDSLGLLPSRSLWVYQ